MSNSESMEEEISEEETYKKVFDDLRHDFEAAKEAKVEIDDMINTWNDLYYSDKKTTTGKGKDKITKSQFSMKEIAKQIEWQKPNITEPFTSTRTPINITAPKSEERARQIEKWANNEFTVEFDREEFFEQASDVVLREGTVWVQTSWEHSIENVREEYPNMTMQEMLMRSDEPSEIEQNNDGTFNVEYNAEKMTRNNPDTVVLRNEHVFPDPGARTEKELRFMATVKLMTLSDLAKLEIISEDKIDILKNKITRESKENTSLGQQRNTDAQKHGFSSSYEPNDAVRKLIRIVEYWGYYDLNGDGIAEPIIAYFAEDFEVDLGVEENPMPDRAIPFDRSVYSARPFSLWGNAVAFFLGDHQRAKNGIMRGIMDNMSLANNGQKFITRGALDYVNFKRMNAGNRNIIVNKPDMIKDGSYNNIPSAVFSTLQMITAESKSLVGVSPDGPALSTEGVAKDGQQAQLTMSQQRMAALVRNLSNMLRKVIGRWISMAEILLTDEQIKDLFVEEELVDMNAFSISGSAKVSVRVATEVNRNMKLQQFNMLMQQSQTLEGQLPPDALKEMVAEMYDLFDMHEKATKIRLYVNEPSEEEKAMQQMSIQNAQLENMKLQTEISVMEKDVEARFMNAQARMMEANANYGYKGAQTEEKLAKADAHKMDNALKPVQIEHEITKDTENKKPNQG